MTLDSPVQRLSPFFSWNASEQAQPPKPASELGFPNDTTLARRNRRLIRNFAIRRRSAPTADGRAGFLAATFGVGRLGSEGQTP